MSETPMIAHAPQPPQDVQSILNSAILVVGPSQSGKSSLLITLVEYIWEVYKLTSLYYLIDGGGIPSHGERLVKLGILKFWRVRTRSSEGLPFETLHRVSQGWWPRRIKASTGETEPNVELVPPVTESYAMYCGKGHHLRTVPYQSMIVPTMCPECKYLIGAHEWQVKVSVKRTPGFERVGGMMIDGLTSSGSWLMDDLSRRLDLGGEKGALGPILSGGMTFGSNNRAHYGSAQSRLQQMALNASGIPGLVVPPAYTALIEEASEGGLLVKAPVIPGSAKSSEVTQWFGDTIETRIDERDGKRYRQMRLQSWIEKTPTGGVRHLCGVRSYPGLLPIVIEEEEKFDEQGRPIPGTAFQQFNLGYYLRLRDEAGKVMAEQYARRFPDAPGLKSEFEEFGDPATIQAPSAAPVGAPLPPPVSTGPAAPALPVPGVVSQAGAAGPTTTVGGAPVVTARRRGSKPEPATQAAQAPAPQEAPSATPPPPVAVVPPAQPTPAPAQAAPAPAPTAPVPPTAAAPAVSSAAPVPAAPPVVTRPLPAGQMPPASTGPVSAPPVARPASPVVSGPAPQPPAPPAAPRRAAVVVPPPPGRRPHTS